MDDTIRKFVYLRTIKKSIILNQDGLGDSRIDLILAICWTHLLSPGVSSLVRST